MLQIMPFLLPLVVVIEVKGLPGGMPSPPALTALGKYQVNAIGISQKKEGIGVDIIRYTSASSSDPGYLAV